MESGKHPLKEMMAGAKPVHSRNISITSYPVDDFRIVVEGHLNDERQVEIYRHWDSKPRAEGPVHGLIARFLVGEWPLTILDAEAEMPTIPNADCVGAEESIKKVIGEQIRSGYSERVRELVGGVNGCTHLTTLIVVMGTAALHGFWTHYARYPRAAPSSLDQVEGLNYLVNSCHLWTEDGPMMQELKALIDRANADKAEAD